MGPLTMGLPLAVDPKKLGTALGSATSGSITKGLPSTRAADGPSYRGSITHVGAGGRVVRADMPSGLGWDERTSWETRDNG